jgi:hypothetical protein
LRTIAAKPTVFSYGTVETATGLAVQRGDGQMGDVADFAYLKSKVPYPFTAEFDPGPGIHIHNKFIVIDFNGDSPAVFTGSSNLAEGGEKANGDSLIMIEDKVLAEIYAIEALKIFDHYSFRDKMKSATDAKPLTLWYPGKQGEATPWWQSSYNPNDIKYRDRCLFAGTPLPANMQSQKNVDWSALGKSAAQPSTPASTSGAVTKKKASRVKSARNATRKRSSAKAKSKGSMKKATRTKTRKKGSPKKTTRRPSTRKKPKG